MSYLVQPRLVNAPYSDPGLYLDFRFGRRALPFDLGDIGPLSSREIVRVSHVFVSHLHVDHFIGFDRLLRLNLYQPRELVIFGPEGTGDGVEAKLRAYRWNLLGPHSADFSITVLGWGDNGFMEASRFRAQEAFARRTIDIPGLPKGTLLEEGDFVVEAEMLDHGIPSLAFAFQERIRISVHKARLDKMGLQVGSWLTKAKYLLRSGATYKTQIEVAPGQSTSLRQLLDEGALHIGPGQRVVYATDLAFTEGNVARLVQLAKRADILFVEAPFLEVDREGAAAKAHLTASQAGRIAGMAGVTRAIPFHFSARYLGNQAELEAEFEASWRSAG